MKQLSHPAMNNSPAQFSPLARHMCHAEDAFFVHACLGRRGWRSCAGLEAFQFWASAPRMTPRKAWLRGAQPAAHDAKGQNSRVGTKRVPRHLVGSLLKLCTSRTAGRPGYEHTLSLNHYDRRRCIISDDTHDCNDDTAPCDRVIQRVGTCATARARACAHLYCDELMSFHDMVRARI